MNNESLLLHAIPRSRAPLDPGFCPCFLANLAYERAVQRAPRREQVALALERENSLVSRWDLEILPWGSDSDEATFIYVERTLKFLLWSRGAWKVLAAAPDGLGKRLQAIYSPGEARGFDRQIMSQAYGRPFELVLSLPADLPVARESNTKIGGFTNGCRIGFDLGASDYKIAAVQDGEVVFSAEYPWNPKDAADPQYHYAALRHGLTEAARKLPRVDAIGGSSAGIIVDNRPMVASLFRSVPPHRFEDEIKPLFLRLGQEWGVPIAVMNDGDVTALAGALSLEATAVLGIAMGSSQAGGYLTRSGQITGWLNELAFAPVDYSPSAAVDEWSLDRGVGALYFSQQAVGRLLPTAGIELPCALALPEQLVEIQRLAGLGDERALRIYETIGVYLGYTVPFYARFYDISQLLLLGRVLTGVGGNLLISKAGEILKSEFPELDRRITLAVPDEKSRRIGQAVAAATLPAL